MASLSKDESILVLDSMGICYPADTKLTRDTLVEKLTKAIDMTQRVASLAPKRIDPEDLKEWREGDGTNSRTLMQIYQECSMDECAHNWFREQVTGNRNEPLGANVFSDARQTLMGIAHHYCGPHRCKIFLVEDAEQTYSITFRLLGVYSLEDSTPLVSVLYDYGPGPGLARAYDFLAARADVVPKIKATPLELKLLVKILEQNSKRVAASFKPSRHFSERTHTRSFLLPLRALTAENIGSLTKSSCARCGVPAVSRCSACQSVAYCSKECQASHWKEHKRLCNPLSKGTWQTVRFSLPEAPEDQVSSMLIINKNAMPSELPKQKIWHLNELPSENVHGSTPFIVKIQVPVLGDINGMMVYDRRRSFVGYIYREADPSAYACIDNLVRTKGIMGLKIYRWAKMVGDWTLDICLDVEPNEPVQW
ncbi:hypothetical protein ACEPAH_7720 [Sanghuangporus vaninii]